MQETMLRINEIYHNFIMPDIGCKKECNPGVHSCNNVNHSKLLLSPGNQLFKNLFLFFNLSSLRLLFF